MVGLPVGDPLIRNLRAMVARAGGAISARRPQLVLSILKVGEKRRDLSLDEHGRAIEYELLYWIEFEIHTPDRKVLWPRDRIELSRIYYNPQIQVIGKAEEEQRLWEEMRREGARLLLSRLKVALERDAAQAESAP